MELVGAKMFWLKDNASTDKKKMKDAASNGLGLGFAIAIRPCHAMPAQYEKTRPAQIATSNR